MGDAEDCELVAEFFVAGEEELFEAFALALAGCAVLRQGDLGGFIIVVASCELDRLTLLA